MDERADLGDFEICNRYNIDNTGLVCKFLLVLHELVPGPGFVLEEELFHKTLAFFFSLFLFCFVLFFCFLFCLNWLVILSVINIPLCWPQRGEIYMWFILGMFSHMVWNC